MSAIGWVKYVENIENILQKIGARGWYKYIGNIERTLQGESAIGWDKYIVNIEWTLQEISVRDWDKYFGNIKKYIAKYKCERLAQIHWKYSVSSLVVPKMEEGISGTGAVKNSK